MKELWREVDSEIRDEFIKWIVGNQEERMAAGEAKYQSSLLGFQGDPLQHAAEELFDGLFYIFYAMRQRKELEAKVERQRSETETSISILRHTPFKCP